MIKDSETEKIMKKAVSKYKERPLTNDTEFLVSIWYGRGDSLLEIAYVMNRPLEQIEHILSRAIISGRYNEHIRIHKEYLSSTAHKKIFI